MIEQVDRVRREDDARCDRVHCKAVGQRTLPKPAQTWQRKGWRRRALASAGTNNEEACGVFLRMSAIIPIRLKTTVPSMNGAPRTAPMPISWLRASLRTSSATIAIMLSGKEEPIAAITAPAALRVKLSFTPSHSTALVNASLATRTSTSVAASCTTSTGPALSLFQSFPLGPVTCTRRRRGRICSTIVAVLAAMRAPCCVAFTALTQMTCASRCSLPNAGRHSCAAGSLSCLVSAKSRCANAVMLSVWILTSFGTRGAE